MNNAKESFIIKHPSWERAKQENTNHEQWESRKNWTRLSGVALSLLIALLLGPKFFKEMPETYHRVLSTVPLFLGILVVVVLVFEILSDSKEPAMPHFSLCQRDGSRLAQLLKEPAILEYNPREVEELIASRINCLNYDRSDLDELRSLAKNFQLQVTF